MTSLEREPEWEDLFLDRLAMWHARMAAIEHDEQIAEFHRTAADVLRRRSTRASS